ncbi:MAG: hypothetical protein L6U99_06160 [Clostridium sp.]|nr:MAG: hypothetical protein L6U99_06160 [Clostridium sp.]
MLISRPIYSKLIIDVLGLFKFDFWKLFMKCLMTLIVLVWNYFGRKIICIQTKGRSLMRFFLLFKYIHKKTK